MGVTPCGGWALTSLEPDVFVGGQLNGSYSRRNVFKGLVTRANNVPAEAGRSRHSNRTSSLEAN